MGLGRWRRKSSNLKSWTDGRHVEPGDHPMSLSDSDWFELKGVPPRRFCVFRQETCNFIPLRRLRSVDIAASAKRPNSSPPRIACRIMSSCRRSLLCFSLLFLCSLVASTLAVVHGITFLTSSSLRDVAHDISNFYSSSTTRYRQHLILVYHMT